MRGIQLPEYKINIKVIGYTNVYIEAIDAETAKQAVFDEPIDGDAVGEIEVTDIISVEEYHRPEINEKDKAMNKAFAEAIARYQEKPIDFVAQNIFPSKVNPAINLEAEPLPSGQLSNIRWYVGKINMDDWPQIKRPKVKLYCSDCHGELYLESYRHGKATYKCSKCGKVLREQTKEIKQDIVM
jgi:tRNA(Ile2) C34 agmatinyltransferase TiaS